MAAALALTTVVVLALRPEYVRRTLGWRLLAHAGWPLSLAGAIFVLRFWTPTPGPYLAEVRYPFGDYLAAWAVSFGFTWMAFGLLFAALAVLAPAGARDSRGLRRAWLALLATWILCWVPHAVIGLGVALDGLDPASAGRYRAWAATSRGAVTLAADALLLLVHLACSAAGFLVAWREAWPRGERPVVARLA